MIFRPSWMLACTCKSVASARPNQGRSWTLRRVSLSRILSANKQSRVGRPGCVHSSTLPSGSTIRLSSSMLCLPGRSLTYTGPPLTCVIRKKDCQRTQVHYTARYLAPPDLSTSTCAFDELYGDTRTDQQRAYPSGWSTNSAGATWNQRHPSQGSVYDNP